MISKRNFFTIATTFLILLFMFQVSGVMKEQLSAYGTNSYADEDTGLSETDCYTADTTGIVFLGDTDSAVGQVVSSYAMYTKQGLAAAQTAQELAGLLPETGALLIADGSFVQTDADISCLCALVSDGTNLIFAKLPDYSVISSSPALQELLGIALTYQESVTVNGMHLFSGFLLGGEALYEVQTEEEEKRQDLDISVPWYITDSGTKTYMVGTLTNQSFWEALSDGIADSYLSQTTDLVSAKNSLLPAILWRNSVGSARVFCINADFMEDSSGVGILAAAVSELSEYSLYPVVNAQNLVAVNFPSFAEENESVMQSYYSQSLSAVYQEVLWPSLVSIAQNAGFTLTCMLTPQLSYADDISPQTDAATDFFKLFQEESVEAGLSAFSIEGLSLTEKLAADESFWTAAVPDYTFLSLYVPDRNDVSEAAALSFRTLAVGEASKSAAFADYADADTTVQYATDDGRSHTFLEDFQLRCRQTALGYSNIVIDLSCTAYPETDEDVWQNLSKTISANVSTYWKAFSAFDDTTLAESDTRLRRFFALSYTSERTDDTITLSIDGFDEEAYFLLRLSDETVKDVSGGSVTEIEDGFFLIAATEPQVTMELEKATNP